MYLTHLTSKQDDGRKQDGGGQLDLDIFFSIPFEPLEAILIFLHQNEPNKEALLLQ